MKRNSAIAFSVLTAALLLSGCGAVQFPENPSAATAESQPMSPTEPFTAGTAPSPAGAYETSDVPGQSSGADSQTPGYPDQDSSDVTQRIQLSYLNLELAVKPDDTKDMVEHLKQSITAQGGYIKFLNTHLYDNSTKKQDTQETDSCGYYCETWTTMTIALPPDKADALVKQLSADYTVITQSETLKDQTNEYKSLLSRQSSLEAEEQQLLTLIKDARDSEKMRSSTGDNDFMNNVLQLENNLWMTRRELSQCRYGDLNDHFDTDLNLSFLDSMKDMTLVNLAVYVDDN